MSDLQPLSSEEFDPFVADVDYPMYVVTTAAGEERSGCLVGFVTQASIDPPRLLVCLSVQNRTYRVAREARYLAVHLLDPDRRELAALFGAHTGDQTDKFAHCEWTAGPDGLPLLADAQRVVVGRVLRREEYGDHVGHLLEPLIVLVAQTGEPLDFRTVRDLDPGHQP